jgi:hypothetical protein
MTLANRMRNRQIKKTAHANFVRNASTEELTLAIVVFVQKLGSRLEMFNMGSLAVVPFEQCDND